MKVKITKTIDLHQIPVEARKMLDQIKNHIVYGLPEKINQVTAYSLSTRGEEFFLSIDAIDSFRQELAAVDESLQEVQNILSGYKKAVMPEQEEDYNEEWLAAEEAETEKRQAQQMDVEDGDHERGEEHEEG
tara:strand:+ start:100 stop:495 length:396 start_codon:yes stop_codon:yes gene_type:complete